MKQFTVADYEAAFAGQRGGVVGVNMRGELIWWPRRNDIEFAGGVKDRRALNQHKQMVDNDLNAVVATVDETGRVR